MRAFFQKNFKNLTNYKILDGSGLFGAMKQTKFDNVM